MSDWKEEMDALMERTRKNWWKTGRSARAMAVTGKLNLGEHKKDKKDEQPR